MKGAKQVNVKRFKTMGVNYHVQFTNAFANVELSEHYNRLHRIFQSLLDEVIQGVPPHDQIRFVGEANWRSQFRFPLCLVSALLLSVC